ncbi:MAG: AtpZ/AtpI family protein [Chloroflexota bacterium]|nr:AtpZ/AtpI family protein [Chloroflexota bacterium]
MKLDRSTLRALGLVSGIGFSIAIAIGGGVLLGIFLDNALGTDPVFLIVGVLGGLALAAYSLYRLTLFRSSSKS